MKAKNRTTHRHRTHREDLLPHEVGAHLFALIKRNLLARRETTPRPSSRQLTFAF
jgi:hypothetical protein